MTFWETQMAHEPTRLYYEKLKEIVNNFSVEIHTGELYTFEILEIGLDVGISARCFLEFENVNLTSVDLGDVEIGIKNIDDLATFRWTFHHMSSDAYFEKCERQFDIIFVDGDHSYEQTKKDIVNAWKFLKPNGLLIGHDYLHKGNFMVNKDYGVHQAFRELLIDINVPATIYPPDPGLIVVRK